MDSCQSNRTIAYPKAILAADGKTLLDPFVDKQPTWLYKPGTTVWSYPAYKSNANPENKWDNYNLENASIYILKTENMKAYSRAGAIWNILTDKNLIDVSEDAKHTEPGKIQALHNAIASTAVADILSRIAYAQHEWIADDTKKLQKPTVEIIPVVPEPNKSGVPKLSIAN